MKSSTESEQTPLLNSGYLSNKPTNKGSTQYMSKADVTLQKKITLPLTCAYIIGTVIGSGIFISPKGVTENVQSVGATLVVWTTVGLYSLLQALCYAELGALIPKAGGDYIYIYHILGPVPAWVCVWLESAIVGPGAGAAIARTAAVYIMQPAGMDCHLHVITLLSVAVVVLFGAINIYSSVLAIRVQNVFTVAKVAALAFIIIVGMVQLAKGHTDNFVSSFERTTTDPGLFSVALLEGYFAFKGWDLVSTLPEEMVNPQRDLPIGIVTSLLTITGIYVLTNVAYFSVLSVDELVKSEAVALSFASAAIPRASVVISIFVSLSCMGTVNGTLMGNSRYLFAAGRCSQIPEMFAMLCVSRYTPVFALIVQTVVGVLYCLIPSISTLVEYVAMGAQLKILLSLTALIYLRWTRPDIQRPIKIPIAIVVVTTLFLLALIGISLYSKPSVSGVGILLFFLAVPVLYMGKLVSQIRGYSSFSDSMTTNIQCLMRVVPESRKETMLTIDELFPKSEYKQDIEVEKKK